MVLYLGNVNFSTSKAYKQLVGIMSVHPIYNWTWKSSCQHNHKVFFWFLIKDRLSTRNLLKRKNMILPSYNCILCNEGIEESRDHLFLECKFARNCWALLGLTIVSSPELEERVTSLKSQLNVKFFMEIIIIMCWSIWTVRNDFIFRNIPAGCIRCVEIFKRIFKLLLWRAKKKYFPDIELWLEHSV